jgi:hypothetical protein
MMHKIFNLTLSVLLITNTFFLFSSCKEESEYDSRVKNIVKYLNEAKNVDVDSCRKIYLLQANKCNTCNGENINVIFQELSQENESDSDSIIFILNGFNEEVLNTLLRKQFQFNFNIITDEDGYLDKLGLSFMKNLSIRTCNQKVIQWKFYQ